MKLAAKFFFYRLTRIPKRSERILGFRMRFVDYFAFCFLFREVFLKGEYWFKTTKMRPLIIDCGANIGLATMYFKYLYPGARVIAFEPIPAFADILERNVSENRLRTVTVVRAGVSDADGETTFHIPFGAEFMASMRSARKGTPVRARLVRLGTFLKGKRIDLLKMDIEGVEMRVLRDLDRTGALGGVDQMIVEYHHYLDGYKGELDKFLAILERNGFVYYLESSLVARSNNEDILIYARKRR